MFFHACNKSDHLQLRPEAAIILQFLRCFGNVTLWNIRLYRTNDADLIACMQAEVVSTRVQKPPQLRPLTEVT